MSITNINIMHDPTSSSLSVPTTSIAQHDAVGHHSLSTTTTTTTTIAAAVDASTASAANDVQLQHHLMLPDILDQLRLMPNQPTIKLPANDYPNPFQLPAAGAAANEGSCSSAASRQAESLRDQLFGPQCVNCRGGASSHHSSSLSAAMRHHRHTHGNGKSAEHSILHPKLFKQRADSSNSSCAANGGYIATGGFSSSSSSSSHSNHDRRRGAVLRQPQLRLLEQCLQHGLTRSCNSLALQSSDRTEAQPSTAAAAVDQTTVGLMAPAPASAAANAQPTRSRPSVQERLQRGYRRWHLHDGNTFADVRSLLTGCENLSLSGSSGSALQAPPGTSGAHKSRAFRQLQQQHQTGTGGRHHGGHHGHHLKSAAGAHHHRSAKLCRSRSEDRVSSGSGRSSASASSQMSAASSCSQQARQASGSAGGGGGAPAQNAECDVTIDELASYFETFVHIPKKMSSMAEMMYI